MPDQIIDAVMAWTAPFSQGFLQCFDQNRLRQQSSRHEALGRSAHCLAQRFGIRRIVLAAFLMYGPTSCGGINFIVCPNDCNCRSMMACSVGPRSPSAATSQRTPPSPCAVAS
jgi:hypothetical protein